MKGHTEDFRALRKKLESLADEKYRAFSARLLPENTKLLGVRLPLLRKIAQEKARGNWRDFLLEEPGDSFEEILLQGMVLGYADAPIQERLTYISAFVPYINNWSICDSFVSGLKFIKDHRERVWEFLSPYLSSQEEFPARFGVVTLLCYYVDDAYLSRVLQQLENIPAGGYYARMAVAWAAAVCCVYDPERTMAWLKEEKLDPVTRYRACQKIIESRAVTAEARAQAILLRREIAKALPTNLKNQGPAK